MILAIDNGVSGSLALLSTIPGLPPAELRSIPTMQARLHHREVSRKKASGTKAKQKVKSLTSNEVDAVALRAIISGFGVAKITAVVFEDCPEHSDMASTLRSMAGSAGKIMAVLELLGLTGVTYRIQSNTWQSDMLAGGKRIPAGQTKALAAEMAQLLCPGMDWRRTPRCSTPDTGHIDAYLIGVWALRHIPGLATTRTSSLPVSTTTTTTNV